MKQLLSVGCYALAALVLAMVVQANIFPTTPVSSTRVAPGGVLNTQWIESSEAPFANQSSRYDLFLMTGGDLDQVQVSVIGTNIPISRTSVPFTIPATLPPGAYFVKFVVGGQSVFSTRFIVTNKDGEVVSTATDVNLGGFLANATSTGTANPTNGTSNTTDEGSSASETGTTGDEDGTGGDGTGKGSDDGSTGEGGENAAPGADGSKRNKTASTTRRLSNSSVTVEDAAISRYALTSSLAAAIAVLFLAALA